MTDDIDYGPLPSLIGYRLKRAYSYSIQSWDALFEELGLPYGHYSVLLLIGLNPGLTQLALAEAVGLDHSTLVPIANRLVNLGWLARVRRRDDKRAYSLRVTAAGQGVLDRARKTLRAHENDLTEPLTSEERRMFLKLLTKITDGRAFGRAQRVATAARKASDTDLG
jgi:DNA-binding MarR family transcriptional regulator